MPIIDGERYPDTYLDVSKHQILREMFLKQIKRDGDMALLALLKAPANFRPQTYYDTFYAPDAKHRLNRFPGLIQKAQGLAETEAWHFISDWKKLHRLATTEAMVRLNSVTLPKVYKKKTFKAHHFENIRRKVKVPSDVIKSLEVKDKAALIDMIAALRVGDDAAARKFGAKAVKKSTLGPKPAQFFESVLSKLK